MTTIKSVKTSEELKEYGLNTLFMQGQQAADAPVHETTSPHVAYHDLPGLRHETKDVLQQLNMNVQLLEDMGGRLGFVISEIRSIVRR